MELKSRGKEEEFKTVFGDDGSVKFVKKSDEARGKKSRSKGGAFEARVRKDLEEKGWVVDKWSNNVNLDEGRVVPCKRVFKRFGVGKGVMTIGTGFPDFVCFEKRGDLYKVIGIEVKVSGKLDREEKEKCKWLLENGVFSEILVASKLKIKNRVHVEYIDVVEILKKMRSQ
jgi:hypothetical protein